MAFVTQLVVTVVKMLFIVAVALGGIKLGKSLREWKDVKAAKVE